MSDWEPCRLHLDDTLRHALKIISDGSLQIGIVTDDEDTLLGIITDGDIRRSLLEGSSLDSNLSTIVNYHPITGLYGTDTKILLGLMRNKKIQTLPLVDEHNRIKDLLSISDYIFKKRRDNIVVLMAGGLGMRLRPLTNSCPKPLLRIGKKPILEIILDSFIDAGFHRFFLAVNYKSKMIEDYFGNGSNWGVEIDYLHEKERMGTAGALYLLPNNIKDPIFVMNGDLLTKVDFSVMLDNHISSKAQATMAMREYQWQVPYGVINFDGKTVLGITEKPMYDFLVSAGIYILNPDAVKIIDSKGFYDMPDLFRKIISSHGRVNGYLIQDYWLDIGRIDDYTKAQEEFGAFFNK